MTSRLVCAPLALLLAACTASSESPDAAVGPRADADAAVADAALADAAVPDAAGAGDDAAVDGGTTAAPEVAYIVTYLAGILAFTIDPATGAPTPLPGSPFDRGAHFYSGALDPSGTLLYAVDLDAGNIHGYHVGGDGQLTAVAHSPFANGGMPITITVDPKGRFVYVGNFGDQSLSVHRIDPATGALTPVDHSPFPLRSIPGCVAADPSGRFIYVTGAGIQAFAVDGQSGALSEIEGSPFGTLFGGGLAVHPSGKFLYAGSLTGFTIDGDSGALAVIDGSPFASVGGSDANAIDIAIDPRGRFVYGISTQAGSASVLSVDAATGVLTPVRGSPFAAGFSPYSIAVDPRGRFVYVGNDDVANFTVFSVAQPEGTLAPIAGSPFSPDGLQPQILMTTLPTGADPDQG